MPSAYTRSVVIIGAGVAGLAAGAYLARHGCRVVVLEANPAIGGCCGSVSVDGYTFTEGAQYLIYSRILDLVFAELGVERSQALAFRRVATPQTTHLPDGVTITIGDDFLVAAEGASIDIARAQDELRLMVKKWEPVGRLLETEDILLSPFSAWKLLARAWRHLPKLGRSLDAEFRLLFNDRHFRSGLAAHMVYAGAPPHQLPSVTIIAAVSALEDGMVLPVGGMGKIPEALAQVLREHGGELLLDARVNRICVQGGRVTGVQTDQQGIIACEQVISTANAMATYGALLDSSAVPGRMLRKVRRTRLAPRALSVQLGTPQKLTLGSHLNYFVPMLEDLNSYFSPVHDLPGWGYFSVPTLLAPELASTGGSVIEYYPVIRQDEPLSAWGEDRVNRLGDLSVAFLQSQFDMTVDARRVRGPREFRDQLNLYDGSVYGVSAAQGITGLFPHRAPVEGLYLAGQTTYPGLGVPTAALSGILAARLVLKARESRA